MLGIHQPLDTDLRMIPLYAKSIQADTFQIFLRNNRNMRRRTFYDADISMFNTSLLQQGIDTFVVHAPYAMNPCTEYSEQRERVINVLKEDLLLLQKFAGTAYYVLHPGSSKDLMPMEALQNVKTCLDAIIPFMGRTRIAIEFMAGAGTQMLCIPEQIEYLMVICSEVPNLCITFDTCHVFGAGYDLDKTFERLKQYIGVVHLNNSDCAFGTHKDRHASITAGKILTEDLLDIYAKTLVLDRNVPVILETPSATLLQDLHFIMDHFKN